MKNLVFLLLVSIFALLLLCSGNTSTSGKAGHTGSPGDGGQTCNACHDGNALNSGIGIIDLAQSNGDPLVSYSPGTTYHLKLTISDPNKTLFGVGLEALQAGNTDGGTLVITAPTETTLLLSGVKTNLVHQPDGGLGTGSKVFLFDWVAPPDNIGNVSFYFSGVTSDADGEAFGDPDDYVYANSLVIGAPDCEGNLGGAALPGEPCSDPDPCTTGEVWSSSCVCEGGIFQDFDGDLTCDANDGCPTDPAKTGPGSCGCNNPEPGATCDDGQSGTTNDVIGNNCLCAGTPIDCDDSDPCTIDYFFNSFCVHDQGPDSDGDLACDAIDGCPNDPAKIDPGTCGCNSPEPGSSCDDNTLCTVDDVIGPNCACAGTTVDTDGDGTCDAFDGCPNDGSKTAPGVCDCNNPEPGTPCDDQDPATINDLIGGNCACAGSGVDCNDNDPCTYDHFTGSFCAHDQGPDSDGDLTCDAIDGCAQDPLKIAPGSCGCGSPEPGTGCDDNNACTVDDVIDPNCACGGTFQDTDGDLTCDAFDGCPNDPLKTDPGSCGCSNLDPGTACDDGVPTTVNDVVGLNCACTGSTVDCNDTDPCTVDSYDGSVCVHDPIMDFDGDGTCDLIDGCPSDPLKTAPGSCGCGSHEPGGTCSDNNACTVNDVIAANCGCAGTFQDTDGDGTCNAFDACPTDPAKTAPGACGCNNPEPGATCDDAQPGTTDDVVGSNCLCAGTPADCGDSDPCTIDSFNGSICVHDQGPDSDGDLTCDAIDGCPNDPTKIAPGSCGCGSPEPGAACSDNNTCTIDDVIGVNCACAGTFQDFDGDLTCDANDGCPTDPAKTIPGSCGCNNPEPGATCTDSDPNTIDDVVGANCVCIGTVVDCNDNDPCTSDSYNGTSCVHDQSQDTDGDGTCDEIDGCPNDFAKITPGICGCGFPEPGAPCSDNIACTVNDVMGANCTCTGTQLQPVAISGPTSVAGWWQATYSVTFVTGATYVWHLPDGWTTADSTGSVVVAHTNNDPGSVQICVTVTVGDCELSDCNDVLLNVSIGIEEAPHDPADQFSLRPNPSNGMFQLLTLDDSAPMSISVHDGIGRAVKALFQVTGQSVVLIDLGDIAPGAYYVLATRNGQRHAMKLLVQR